MTFNYTTWDVYNSPMSALKSQEIEALKQIRSPLPEDRDSQDPIHRALSDFTKSFNQILSSARMHPNGLIRSYPSIFYRNVMGNGPHFSVAFDSFCEEVQGELGLAASTARGYTSPRKKRGYLRALKSLEERFERLVAQVKGMDDPHFIMIRQFGTMSDEFDATMLYLDARAHLRPLQYLLNRFFEDNDSLTLSRYVEASGILFESPHFNELLEQRTRWQHPAPESRKLFIELQKELEVASLFYQADKGEAGSK